MSPSLPQLLKTVVDHNASDLHIAAGAPPHIRIDGALIRLKTPPLSSEDTLALCTSLLDDKQRAQLEQRRSLRLAIDFPLHDRFRVQMYFCANGLGGAFRLVPGKIRGVEQLGLPPIVGELCARRRGLILVAGPAGAGVSTTLAAMLDKINTDTRGVIHTYEDPIEHLHAHRGCVVAQREGGRHASSPQHWYADALHSDADVVMLGPVDEHAKLSSALALAESGRMVLATVRARSTVRALELLTELPSIERTESLRARLAASLEAVIAQALVPRVGGGRAVAVETLLVDASARAILRSTSSLLPLRALIARAPSAAGVATLEQSLAGLVTRRLVAAESALAAASDTDDLRALVSAGATSQRA